MGTKDGTAIGLINAGDVGHVAVYADEMFFTTYEITTGNSKNSRIQNAGSNRYVLNSLIFSNTSTGFNADRKSWALGYGLKRFIYNRSVTPGMSEFRFLAYGVEFLHINHTPKSITKELSLLMRPKVQFGTRFHPKIRNIYGFVAVTYNAYVSKSNTEISPSFLESNSTVSSRVVQLWPGISAGLLLHD